MTLSEEHINYIIKDISYRGIVDDELGDELVDHICSLVEEKMQEGARFIDAYDKVIKAFGSDSKLNQLQLDTITYSNNNTKIMVKNYFKIAYRNLLKHKFYSVINIVGLSVGVACSLLIMLYIMNERNYDNFHEKGERIYRLNRQGKYGDNEFHFPVAPAPMADALVKELEVVENAVRFRTQGSYLIKMPEAIESNKEEKIIFTDSTFFDVFSFKVIEGNPKSALNRPKTLAMSQSAAHKYFNGQSALGKTLILDGKENYEVTAVFEDMPGNSHLQYDFLLAMAGLEDALNGRWLSNNYFTYIVAAEGVEEEELIKQIQRLYDQKMEPQLEQYAGTSLAEFKAAGNYMNTTLQPLESIYLTSSFTFDIGRMGDAQTINLFAAISLFIIILACINFMNLSTARSANRAKEVGIRKALGSYRSHLVRQFLTESIIMSFMAFAMGILLAQVMLPFFNQLSEKSLSIPLNNIWFVLSLVGGALTIGVVAGLYPAFFLSSFRPIQALKGKLTIGSGSSYIRSGLVVFQFFISILLITGTIAIQKQLNFIQNKKIGFNKEQVLVVFDTYMLSDQRSAFKEELDAHSQVLASSYSGFIPINGFYRSDNTYWQKGFVPDETNLVSMQMWSVDNDYLATFDMKLVDGRNFNKEMASDSNAIILNQTAMKRFGFKSIEEAQVQTFAWNDERQDFDTDKFEELKVIGVVEDFHFESMKENIGPLALRLGKQSGIISIRLNTNDLQASVEDVENLWKKFGSGLPFNYEFLDTMFGEMYKTETRLGSIFAIFSGLAIFIGCLGLFALAAFMGEQRTKEIGIRKVLGASVNSIVLMLSKDFSKLVVIAFLVAIPVSWYGINYWLSHYTYKITLGVELFLIAGVCSILIAWITVGYQSIKSAIGNPVDALRSE